MAFDPISLALSKNYTAETAEGMGAIQGKPGPAGSQGPEGPPGPQGPPGADGGGMSLVYSEEERVVGTWVDGRPVYQKTWLDVDVAPTQNQKPEYFTISDDPDIEVVYAEAILDVKNAAWIFQQILRPSDSVLLCRLVWKRPLPGACYASLCPKI